VPSSANYTPSVPLPVKQAIGGTTETQILNPNNTSVPLFVTIPANSILDGKPWSGKIAGVIASLGAAATVTLKLYSGNSATIGNNTALASSGAVNQATATSPFIVSIEDAIYDSTSGKLNGIAEMLVNNTIVARAAFSNVVTGISGSNNPVLTLSLTATISVFNAGNYVQVNVFEVDW
jgi:hypothetical protein